MNTYSRLKAKKDKIFSYKKARKQLANKEMNVYICIKLALARARKAFSSAKSICNSFLNQKAVFVQRSFV